MYDDGVVIGPVVSAETITPEVSCLLCQHRRQPETLDERFRDVSTEAPMKLASQVFDKSFISTQTRMFPFALPTHPGE